MGMGVKRFFSSRNRLFELRYFARSGKYALNAIFMDNSDRSWNSRKIFVVAINMAVMIAYTLYTRYVESGELNIILNAFFVGIHAVLCLILAIFVWRKEFLLSALLVLLIGFSTCWVIFTH
jgi:hypothetical protein